MARKPPEYTTAQPAATPATPAASQPAPPTGYIVDSTGAAAAGGSRAPLPSHRAPLATNQADFRVANHIRHREQKFSNLPIETARSRQLKEETDRAVEAQAQARNRSVPGRNKVWCKFGVQPVVGGFVIHTEYFEGDVKVREGTPRVLSPFAMREQFALLMAALHQQIGL